MENLQRSSVSDAIYLRDMNSEYSSEPQHRQANSYTHGYGWAEGFECTSLWNGY